MTKCRMGFVVSLLALFLLSTSPVFANGVRSDLSASGKGVLDGDCATNIKTIPACFQFSQLSSTEATWEAFNLTDFDAGTFTTLGPFNIFMVNGIVSGTQVTFTLPGTNDHFDTFFCGEPDPGMVSISDAGFCADPSNLLNGDASGFFSQLPSATDAANQATYIFNGNAPSSWVFYASPDATMTVSTGTTATPEPGTLLLLVAGAGLLAAGKLRRA